MQVIRFIFPFLFVRNWHDGQWELSRARCVLFGLSLALVLVGIVLVYYLQAPVVYTAV
jgi:hypothetical protein